MNKLFNSFKYAWQGIKSVVKHETNMKIHVFVSIFVLLMALFLGISAKAWVTVILCIGLVMASEMFNTAIELIVDKISPEKNPIAGKIKDISAGAVLVTAIISVIIGCIIFIPKIIQWLFG